MTQHESILFIFDLPVFPTLFSREVLNVGILCACVWPLQFDLDFYSKILLNLQ